jgi:hypothetical protein
VSTGDAKLVAEVKHFAETEDNPLRQVLDERLREENAPPF